MRGLVVCRTKPRHHQAVLVVVVMRVRSCAADLARPPLKAPVAHRVVDCDLRFASIRVPLAPCFRDLPTKGFPSRVLRPLCVVGSVLIDFGGAIGSHSTADARLASAMAFVEVRRRLVRTALGALHGQNGMSESMSSKPVSVFGALARPDGADWRCPLASVRGSACRCCGLRC